MLCCTVCVSVHMCAFVCGVRYTALIAAMVKVREQEARGISGPDQTCKHFMGAHKSMGVCMCESSSCNYITNQLFLPAVLCHSF